MNKNTFKKLNKRIQALLVSAVLFTAIYPVLPAAAETVTAVSKYAYEPGNVMITGWRDKFNNYTDGSKGASMLSWKNPTSATLSGVKIYRIDENAETDVTSLAKAHIGQESAYATLTTPSAVGRLIEQHSETSGSIAYRLEFSFTDKAATSVIYSDKWQASGGIQLLKAESPKNNGDQYMMYCIGNKVKNNNADEWFTMAPANLLSVSSEKQSSGNTSLKFEANTWARVCKDGSWIGISGSNDSAYLQENAGLTAGETYKIKMKINTVEQAYFNVGSQTNRVLLPNTNGKWKDFETAFTAQNNNMYLKTSSADGEIRELYIDDVKIYNTAGTTLVYSDDFERSATESLKSAPQGLSAVQSGDKVKISWTSAEYDYINVYEVDENGEYIFKAHVPKTDLSVEIANLEMNKSHSFAVKAVRESKLVNYAGFESKAAYTSVTLEEAVTDKYEYEAGNFVLAKSGKLTFRNPKSEKLESVKVYNITDSGETDVTSTLTAVNLSGSTVSVNTPDAVVSLAGAASGSNSCNVRLVFTFSNGITRELLYSDTYDTGNTFIVKENSATENPKESGSYLNVDLFKDQPDVGAELSETVCRSGKSSVKLMSNKAKSDSQYFALQFGGLEKGQKYNVTMWINTIETVPLILGDDTSSVNATLSNTGGTWVEKKFDYTCGSSFRIRPNGFFREIYIDDITFTKSGETTPYLTMGFETKGYTVGGDLENITYSVGDGTLKFGWTETPPWGLRYNVAVYEKVSVSGADVLALRARIPWKSSDGVTINNLTNDKPHTFIFKVENNEQVGGRGLGSEGVTVTATPHYYVDKALLIKKTEKQYEELQDLLASCSDKGIYPSYERSDAELVKVYAGKMQREFDAFNYDNIEKYSEYANKFYEETRTALEAVLSGEKTPVTVDDTKAKAVKVKGGDIVSVSSDGTEAPQVGIGFCAFRSSDTDISDMGDLGFNAIQLDGIQKGPVHMVEYDEEAEDFIKNTTYADTELDNVRATLEICRQKGITVDAGIPTHYIDENIGTYKGASDFRSEGGTYSGCIRFNTSSQTAQKMLKKYFEVYIPVLYEYKDVISSITFVNEPSFEAYDKSFYFDKWTDWLEAKYDNSITALNLAYNKSYSSFDDVSMPEYIPGRDENSSQAWTTALHMDYRLFVTDIMYDYFDFCINEINKYTNSEIPCGVKTMQFFRNNLARWENSYPRKISFDYEKMVQLFGFNGTDTFTHYGTDMTIPAKLSWYDFMTSVKNVPIVDSETHISIDETGDTSSLDAGADVAEYAAASIWQGAVHGCDLTATWLYADDENSSPYYGASFSRNPDALKSLAHTALDAKRLSKEITALQQEKRDVAILYSYECYMLNLQYEANKTKTYQALLNSGQRPLYITENSLDKLSDVKLLVIPGNLIIKDEGSLDKMLEFEENGGKIVIIGGSVFSRDENNNALTSSAALNKVSSLKANSNTTLISAEIKEDTAKSTFPDSLAENLSTVLEDLGLLLVKVIDKQKNKIAAVEWNAVECEGDTIINICNYGDTDITAQIYINGVLETDCDDIKNLSSGLSEITLKKNTPVMLKIENVAAGFSLKDSGGVEASGIKEGAYTARATVKNNSSEGINAVLFAGLYKDGALYSALKSDPKPVEAGKTEAVSLKENINVPDVSDGEYTLRLMLWDGLDSLKPICNALSLEETTE